MVRDCAIKILDLIRNNDGLDKSELLKSNIEIQKIIDIILGECRCSIIDKDGNYARFGSSTDIRVIKLLIQIFLSNAKEIPPEVVSMALTKEGVIGPFKNISFEKKYNSKDDIYNIKMEEIFPNEFHVNIFNDNIEVKERFMKDVIKPYVKDIIFENEILMSKSPIGAYINKHIVRLLVPQKSNEQMVQDLIVILKSEINSNPDLIDNIANYIFINIMNNKFFKDELVSRTVDATELQKLGRISIGFNSLVESMAYECLQMIELRSFPYGEIISIKNTFNTLVAVLNVLSMSFEDLGEDEILEKIEKINVNYMNKSDVKYRDKNIESNKYEVPIEFVDVENIKDGMKNLCKMIKVLLDKKDEIDTSVYLKEVLRIHYRFIRIEPFDGANGRTARAMVNILLSSKGMLGIFRKEDRKDYIEYINEANKVIKKNEKKYIKGLSEKTMECIGLENDFLDKDVIPFLLVKC